MTDEPTSVELVVPGIGEVVSLDDFQACTHALIAIRDLERDWKATKRDLTDAIVSYASRRGEKTVDLGDHKVQVTNEEGVTYDAEAIEEGLRAAGMPEDRIREIVVETVTYSVKAVEAKRAAKANPEYDRIIAKNSEPFVKRPYVKIL